jgi:hypothetical protein
MPISALHFTPAFPTRLHPPTPSPLSDVCQAGLVPQRSIEVRRSHEGSVSHRALIAGCRPPSHWLLPPLVPLFAKRGVERKRRNCTCETDGWDPHVIVYGMLFLELVAKHSLWLDLIDSELTPPRVWSGAAPSRVGAIPNTKCRSNFVLSHE